EDEDLEEDEFKEEEDPQEEEDDMEVDIEEDKNEPELTYPYEEMVSLYPPPPVSESEPNDEIEVEDAVKPEIETVPVSVYETIVWSRDGTCIGQRERKSKEWLHWSKRKVKEKGKFYGKLILDLGNEVHFSLEQGTATMETLVEKLGNVEDKVECKKLKKELEEARLSNTFLRMQNERVERDLYWTRCNPAVFRGVEGAVKLRRWLENYTESFSRSVNCRRARRCVVAVRYIRRTNFELGDDVVVLNSEVKELALEWSRMSRNSNLEMQEFWKERSESGRAFKEEIVVTCYDCGEQGHTRNRCPKKVKQEEVGEVRGRAYAIKDAEPQGLNVVTDVIMGNGLACHAWMLISSYGKKVVHIPQASCHLFLAHVTEKKLKEKRLEDVPIICDFPKLFPEELPRLPPPRKVEFRIDLVPGAAPVTRALYRLAPSEMKELSRTKKSMRSIFEGYSGAALRRKIDTKFSNSVKLRRKRRKGKVKARHKTILDCCNTPNPVRSGKGLLKDFVSGLRRTKPRGKRLYGETHATKNEEIVVGIVVPVSIISDQDSHFTSRFWRSLQEALGTNLDMSTAYHPQMDGQSERTIQTLEDMLRACVIDFGSSWDHHLPLVEFSYNNSYHASIKAAPYEALYGRKCRSPVCWSEVGDSQLTSPELIRDTTEKIVQIKNRLLTARSRQKSYADKRLKSLEFEVGDMVLLKVSPWKGAVHFGKHGKLSPRYIGPFKILARVGPVAYTLELPEELKGIHSTFNVSNLKKCLAEGDIVVLIDEIQLDDKLHMIEEAVEVVDREVKRLKQSRIPIVKVRWNSQRGPEFTWEREDQIRKKYPHLFTSSEESG
ncbi:putative reverse transcriptase domain-containing protein, partial [Tanacetum coccineum]